MPPPKGSMNALKNGTRLTRLTLGELPHPMRRQQTNARKYRRALEACTRALRPDGELTTTDAHLIDEATQAEVHAGVCRWLLRNRLDKMSVSDIAKCSEQILKAKGIRNRAVERLDLDAEPPSTLETLYGKPP